MKKRLLAFILLIATLLCLWSCSEKNGVSTLSIGFIDVGQGDSTFSIHFIDVGQGDSALVECDGHYMLIDGGPKSAEDKVYDTLEKKGIQRLDILAISHLHADHIGGLKKALTYASKIGITICNSDNSDNKYFSDLKHELSTNGSKIMVPAIGDKYELGSATVKVVDLSADEGNDSLVLLITYGNTRFLFTGDIEHDAQKRISNNEQNESDDSFDIDLIKMPHHGSYSGTLYRFLRTFIPEYVVISVGAGNTYGHPDKRTLDLLDSKTWKPKVYRTDQDGDIFVKSNGKELSVETNKKNN
jgi:competence protein ComEC